MTCFSFAYHLCVLFTAFHLNAVLHGHFSRKVLCKNSHIILIAFDAVLEIHSVELDLFVSIWNKSCVFFFQ